MQGKTIRCNGKSISKSIDEDLKQRMIHSKLANQVKIHFPPSVSDSPDAYEEIRISANDGERTAYTTICLSRIFKDNGQPDPEPEALPEEAKFKMIMAEFTPLMHIESLLPSPLDLITFRITDINGHYMPTVFLSLQTITILLCGVQIIFLTRSKSMNIMLQQKEKKRFFLNNGVHTFSRVVL